MKRLSINLRRQQNNTKEQWILGQTLLAEEKNNEIETLFGSTHYEIKTNKGKI